ncbi:MAG: hypothetical protein AAF810_27495 [Cyanobacteria bacterium P01_D01_bin.36]
MKAIETTATINGQGQLHLDSPLEMSENQRVRVIVLVAEENESVSNEIPKQEILDDFRQSISDALSGKTLPVSQLWEGIDAD